MSSLIGHLGPNRVFNSLGSLSSDLILAYSGQDISMCLTISGSLHLVQKSCGDFFHQVAMSHSGVTDPESGQLYLVPPYQGSILDPLRYCGSYFA